MQERGAKLGRRQRGALCAAVFASTQAIPDDLFERLTFRGKGACQSGMAIKLGSVDCENKKWRDANAFATCENGYYRTRDEFHLLVAEIKPDTHDWRCQEHSSMVATRLGAPRTRSPKPTDITP